MSNHRRIAQIMTLLRNMDPSRLMSPEGLWIEKQEMNDAHNLGKLADLGVSEPHLMAIQETISQMTFNRQMSRPAASDWVTERVRSIYLSGVPLSDETFEAILRQAGIEP